MLNLKFKNINMFLLFSRSLFLFSYKWILLTSLIYMFIYNYSTWVNYTYRVQRCLYAYMSYDEFVHNNHFLDLQIFMISFVM